MAHRSISRSTTAALTLLAIAAAGLSACGGNAKKPASTVASATTGGTKAARAATPAGPAKVAVTLSEFKIKPAVASVRSGRVAFVVTNGGHVKHQFTIIRTDKPASTVLSKQNPDDDIPGARGELASLAPGTTKTLVVKHLKPGHYALVCALPGHYQAGMYADFTVR